MTLWDEVVATSVKRQKVFYFQSLVMEKLVELPVDMISVTPPLRDFAPLT
ncbi:hypothetical protein [Roseicyclus elongatus]|nr:hypothetical protein [Roseibacterium elongatum]